MDNDENDILREAQRILLAGGEIPPDLDARLGAVFASHRPRLTRIVRGWVRDATKAEDIVQDALVVGWRRLPEFRFEGSFVAYLTATAHNLFRRNARKLGELLTEDGVADTVSSEMSVLKELRDEEQLRVLAEAIADLPKLEQDAMYMRYELGLSQDEITEQLGLDQASGARGLLQAGRRHLKVRLRSALINLGHGSSFFESSPE